jgi:hypothetical protein
MPPLLKRIAIAEGLVVEAGMEHERVMNLLISAKVKVGGVGIAEKRGTAATHAFRGFPVGGLRF